MKTNGKAYILMRQKIHNVLNVERQKDHRSGGQKQSTRSLGHVIHINDYLENALKYSSRLVVTRSGTRGRCCNHNKMSCANNRQNYSSPTSRDVLVETFTVNDYDSK